MGHGADGQYLSVSALWCFVCSPLHAVCSPREIRISSLTANDGTDVKTLEVCRQQDKKGVKLGYAHVGTSLVYPLAALQYALTENPSIPTKIFTLTIETYSALGLHWHKANTECFFEKQLKAFFTQGEFPKALSFWVDSSAITVWYSSVSRSAPRVLARFEVTDALSVAVSASSKEVLFYVARGNPGRIEVYDMTSPTHLSLLTPLMTTHESLQINSPVDISLLNGDSKSLLVVLDSHTASTFLLDTNLQLISTTSIWEGMTRPLGNPQSVFCIETPSRETPDIFDCYITDTANNRLILLQFDTANQSSIFISEASTAETGAQRLMEPQMVVAYAYNGFTLIYVAEVRHARCPGFTSLLSHLPLV